MRFLSALTVFAFLFFQPIAGQFFELGSGWKARMASELSLTGEELSSGYEPDESWLDAVVPGTVLTTLLNEELVADPFIGMNNMVIPDISETGPEEYTYWFINSFPLHELNEGQRVWLDFRGINYAADIYLNGNRLVDELHRGMFLRQRFDVTDYVMVGEPNHLAVLVYPPDHPGVPNGGEGGDGRIALNVTSQLTAGWNWVTHVADRNTGIWDRVAVEITGPVRIVKPYITSSVPGARVPGEVQSPAFVTVTASLHNSSDRVVSGTFEAYVDGTRRRARVEIEPGEVKEVSLRRVRVRQPRLWWPNGIGSQGRYSADLVFTCSDMDISSFRRVPFGIREFSARYDEESGAPIFMVNGYDVFIRGANRSGSDLMLRHSRARYNAEVRMYADMNMNMVRVTGSSITERPEFYEACDRHGIMVWQDLWITADCNGAWPDPKKADNAETRRGYPEDHQLFIKSVEDQVLMLRNHPSLLLWCGGDRIAPPASVDAYLRDTLFPTLDAERLYISSSGDLGGTAGSGTYREQGPLKPLPPQQFFEKQLPAFNSAIGSVGLPVEESLKLSLTPEALVIPDDRMPDVEWEFHKYLTYGDLPGRYGDPTSFSDFNMKAQLVNYTQYRAIAESYGAGMWSRYTGLLIWKGNSIWSSLRAQLYDYTLQPNAGYYGFRKGSEPLSALYNPADEAIYVINTTHRNRSSLSVSYSLFDLNGNRVGGADTTITAPSGRVSYAGRANIPRERDEVLFMRVRAGGRLQHDQGSINWYWIAPEGEDYSSLNRLEEATLYTEIHRLSDERIQLDILNNSDVPAFFIRLRVIDPDTGEAVTPLFFEDNYLTLMPGERSYIRADISMVPSGYTSKPLAVEFKGFNVERTYIGYQ